mmetsp:Transcript_1839/g.3221  ORF Transcript_1839/g.3221 Transcript_1839/m.3221 type:complete len:256 (-) Transcript_1839:3087-3854(-)
MADIEKSSDLTTTPSVLLRWLTLKTACLQKSNTSTKNSPLNKAFTVLSKTMHTTLRSLLYRSRTLSVALAHDHANNIILTWVEPSDISIQACIADKDRVVRRCASVSCTAVHERKLKSCHSLNTDPSKPAVRKVAKFVACAVPLRFLNLSKRAARPEATAPNNALKKGSTAQQSASMRKRLTRLSIIAPRRCREKWSLEQLSAQTRHMVNQLARDICMNILAAADERLAATCLKTTDVFSALSARMITAHAHQTK